MLHPLSNLEWLRARVAFQHHVKCLIFLALEHHVFNRGGDLVVTRAVRTQQRFFKISPTVKALGTDDGLALFAGDWVANDLMADQTLEVFAQVVGL